MTETSHSVTPLRGESAVEAQASAWVARLDSDSWTDDDQRQLRAWLRGDPARREALQKMAALWGELDTLTALLEQPPSRRQRWPWLIAPAALAAGLMAALLHNPNPQPHVQEQQPQGLHTTSTGVQREIVLPDGSRLHLNTRSYAQVDYSDTTRRITLLSGEAFFDVIRDPQRPFLVKAGHHEIQAVGTAFSVRMHPRELEVLVTEGVVEVSDGPIDAASSEAAAPALQAISLRAGQRIRVDERKPAAIESLPEEEVTRQLLWREQLLGFVDAPLADVIAEYNRYSPTSIVISDEALRDMRIGGHFRTDDPDALLQALEKSFGIRVVRGGDVILLSRRGTSP